jgi:predicted DNA-binding transcriptional regulator AlpA
MAEKKYNGTPVVCKRYNVSRVTLHRYVSEGLFPEPLRIGPKIKAWTDEMLDAHDARLEAEAKQRAEERAARNAERGRAA